MTESAFTATPALGASGAPAATSAHIAIFTVFTEQFGAQRIAGQWLEQRIDRRAPGLAHVAADPLHLHARGVGPLARLAQQVLPLVARQALIVPVGARMLAAMVEEADIVVLAHQRPDLAHDEFFELDQIGRDVGGNVEIHDALPR